MAVTKKDRDRMKWCRGCDSDYYNGQGAEKCWSRESAKKVTRYKIEWWTRPDQPGAFTKTRDFDCFTKTGKMSYQDTLHSLARDRK